MQITSTNKIRTNGTINNKQFVIIRNKPKKFHIYLDGKKFDNAKSKGEALEKIADTQQQKLWE